MTQSASSKEKRYTLKEAKREWKILNEKKNNNQLQAMDFGVERMRILTKLGFEV
jgi:hypothetical protein